MPPKDPHAPATVNKKFIKDVTGRKITSRLPIWKQNNMQATAAALNKKRLVATLDADDAAAEALLEAEWAWVSAMRQHSETLEGQLDAGALADDWQTNGWPAAPS